MSNRYLVSGITGTIKIESNISVVLKQDVMVTASLNKNDYLVDDLFFDDALGRENGMSVIYSNGSENIEISAERNGILNGQGNVAGTSDSYAKPGLIRLVNCKNVKITNITLMDSSHWGIYLQNCENVTISNVTIISKWRPNNYGICIDSSKNILVDNCVFNTGDDAVVIRTTRETPCEDVTITNCEISSLWSAIKIGTESVGDIRNILFRDSVVKLALGCSIKVAVVDGGILDGLLVENVKMQEVTGPIFVVNGVRNQKYYQTKGRSNGISAIKNVKIKNVDADVIKSQWYLAQGVGDCVFVSGTKDSKISNFSIEDCNFLMPGGNLVENDYLVEELTDQYPEYYSLGFSPSSGGFFRHIDGLSLKNVKIELKEEDIREKTKFEDVTLC